MSDLRFELRAINEAFTSGSESRPTLPLNDRHELLVGICGALRRNIEFNVSGFGQARWPVDVETDLPLFLDQLPAAILNADSGLAFEIDFYEQGLERRIEFSPVGKSFYVSCSSGTDWRPEPKFLNIDQNSVVSLLREPMERFVEIVVSALPVVLQNPCFQSWRDGG